MTRYLMGLALALLLCGMPVNPASASDQPLVGGLEHLRIGNHVRSYRLFVPPRIRGAANLIIALHGGGSTETGASMESGVGLDAQAVKHGWIVAYPDASAGKFNAGACCNTKRPDDVAFVSHMIARVVAAHRIKRARVYAVGFSNGGMLAYRLACERSDLVSAIAVVAAAQVIRPCAPQHPVSVLHIHARNDPKLPYLQRRFGSPPIATLSAQWSRRDHCRIHVATRVIAPGFTQSAARRCAEGTVVQLVTGATFGHAWPGAPGPYGPRPPVGFSATEAIASFLTGLPVRSTATPARTKTPALALPRNRAAAATGVARADAASACPGSGSVAVR